MRWILVLLAVLAFSQPVKADPLFVSKPIYCDYHEEEMGSLFLRFKQDGLEPLWGGTGVTWRDDEETDYAEFYFFVNLETQQWALVELDSEIICLLSGGTVIEFNPETLRDYLNWDDYGR